MKTHDKYDPRKVFYESCADQVNFCTNLTINMHIIEFQHLQNFGRFTQKNFFYYSNMLMFSVLACQQC